MTKTLITAGHLVVGLQVASLSACAPLPCFFCPNLPKPTCTTPCGLGLFDSADCASLNRRELAAAQALKPVLHIDTCAALSGWKVQTMPTESWDAAYVSRDKYVTGHVAGQTLCELRVMRLGPSFAALAHEAVHASECPVVSDCSTWSLERLQAVEAANAAVTP